ncbi:MAG: magnesium chelatase subunit D [Pseudomonadota bacterium]
MRDLPGDGAEDGPEGEDLGTAWSRAALAAALFAIDPAGFGGVVLRARPGPVREAWQALLQGLIPAGTPMRRLPLGIGEDRLLGGLDLAATLSAGKPVVQRGVMADTDGGVLVLPGSERLSPATAAHLVAALDTKQVAMERDGLQARHRVRLGIVAFDEGVGPDEGTPDALTDRLAFHCDLSGVGIRQVEPGTVTAIEVMRAAACWRTVTLAGEGLEALCRLAATLGVHSIRGSLLAVRAARVLAALDDRRAVEEADIALATQLVLAPRATQWPEAAPEQEETAEDEPPPEDRNLSDEVDSEPNDQALSELLLAAAKAALPPAVLAQLAGGVRRGQGGGGKAGQLRVSALRGRPIGTRRGELRGGARLSVIETLRAAAPWQPVRRRAGERRVAVRRDDFRVRRFKDRTETVTIFAVDASGSAALTRLSEVKGAVELLLAEAYRRRDQVALLSFRGTGAELILPPTRSLVRAKRALAGLPGGGGTPLATAIDAAAELARITRRQGPTPIAVFLTDGKANVTRDGHGGRSQAMDDALAAARRLRADGTDALLIDASPRPRPQAKAIAEAMGARYLPLPHADRQAVALAVRDTADGVRA